MSIFNVFYQIGYSPGKGFLEQAKKSPSVQEGLLE